ncbi:MAG: rRNA maturation RNase YbeY [Verrucomicrobiota bacterium]
MILDVRNRQRSHPVNLTRLRQLAVIVAADFQSLSIVLVGDAEMARLNLRYHAVAGTTDVLSFDYGAGHGELIISVARAIDQARRYRTTPSRELALYIVHGVLHLQGYDDLTPGKRRQMRAAERRLLRKLDFRGLLPVR